MRRALAALVLAAQALGTLIAQGGAGVSPAAAASPSGTGLRAEYFDSAAFTIRKVVRTDRRVDFAWRGGSPASPVAADTFSARWTGFVEPATSGTYTFFTQTDDGARLWIDGKLIVNRWRNQAVTEAAGRIALQAGRRYALRMDYYDARGPATARLLWAGPSVRKQVVPTARLFPPGTPPATPPPPRPATPTPPSAPPSATDAQRWSDPATWGGSVPAQGAAVTIPAGRTVLLDVSPPALASVQVDGTLVFAETDLTLRADVVMVHGRLQVGTPQAPFKHRAKISLTGSDPAANHMGMGAKVLGVMGGTLELHGQPRPGWTHLAATALKGANQLRLATTPGWRPGDRIVVSSTDYNPGQAEEATITAVSGALVTLDRALTSTHWGALQTVDGRTVDERAQVALLSRNVVVEGEQTSSAGGFGGQVMVMGGGTARVQGAELTRMGQRNVLRRYPLHFHMLGAAHGSYLKDSSLHHTFNRCVVVHGTNGLTLAGNVCHDHVGHGYFLEDGAEVGNTFSGNLGLTTRKPAAGEGLLPSDRSPATFWITNPDNVLRGNVAAGSQGIGFWLAFPEHPTGLSTNPNVWPLRTPLGEFSNNTAHSNEGDGLQVDGGPRPDGTTDSSFYDPRVDPAKGDSAAAPAVFEGFTAYKNREHGVWLRGANHRVVHATLADNAIGATFASSRSVLADSLVVGETGNLGTPHHWEAKGSGGRSLPRFWDADFPVRGFEFYDGRVGTERTTFANFTPNAQRQASGLGYLLSDAFGIEPHNFAQALRFVDANAVYLTNPQPGKDGDASEVFVDVDGSVTGAAGRVVVVNNPFLLNSSCAYRAPWNAHVCSGSYATLNVKSLDGAPGAVKPLTLRRSDGVEQRLMGCCADSTDAESTVFANTHHDVTFNGATPARARFVLRNGVNRWLQVSVAYPVTPKVTKYGCDVGAPGWCAGAARSLDELAAKSSSAYYYDAAARRLHLKLVAGSATWEELRVQPR